jgi:predicted nucleotidyltransferase
VIDSVTRWAARQDDAAALALVGSYAYGKPRMSSDVDLVLVTTEPDRHTQGIDWILPMDPGARLIRDQTWGPLRERRVRLRSGLHVELGLVTPEWLSLPLDHGTAKVLGDGCRVLHDPQGLLHDTLRHIQRAGEGQPDSR